jgi:hypothetical protein
MYKRKQGRPRYNRRLISRARLDKLPDNFTLSSGAKILNVAPETLRRWVLLHECPCLHSRGNGNAHFTFYKANFIRWLIKTDRFRPRYYESF